jgi:hypothetical protein
MPHRGLPLRPCPRTEQGGGQVLARYVPPNLLPTRTSTSSSAELPGIRFLKFLLKRPPFWLQKTRPQRSRPQRQKSEATPRRRVWSGSAPKLGGGQRACEAEPARKPPHFQSQNLPGSKPLVPPCHSPGRPEPGQVTRPPTGHLRPPSSSLTAGRRPHNRRSFGWRPRRPAPVPAR